MIPAMQDKGFGHSTLAAEGTSPSPGSSGAAASTRWALRPGLVLKLALLAAVLVYVVRAMVRQLAHVPWATLSVQPHFLVLAIAANCLASFLSAVGYRTLLSAFCAPPSMAAVCAVAWIPNLGKYVPGKVASLAGAAWLLRHYRIPAATAAGVVVVQQGLWILTGFLLAAPLCLWEPIRQRLPLAWAWCLAAMVTGVVLLHPRVFGSLGNVLLRKLRRPALVPLPRMRRYLPPVLLMIAAWMLLGVTTWLAARSVVQVPVARLPILTAAIALASSLGLLALFAPGGIGVREGVLLMVLAPVTGATTAVVAVLMRLLQTLEEVLLAGIGTVIFWRLRDRDHDRD
jgi:hypothetical protein